MFVVPEERRGVHNGDRFGKWTVLGVPFYLPHGTRGANQQHCVAACDCGKVRIVWIFSLTRGRSVSCGCLRSLEPRLGTLTPNYKHGGKNTRLFGIWTGLHTRCNNSRVKCYEGYGGRGIKVCDEWRDFVSFRCWAVGNGYRDDLTIDRIDNDGNYEPSNCRWVTKAIQNRNKRNNRYLTAFGETKSMKDWSLDKRCCVAYSTLSARVTRSHDHEKAITTPVRLKAGKA